MAEIDFEQSYKKLPVVLQQYVSPKEYAWMTDEQKWALQQELTEPAHDWID